MKLLIEEGRVLEQLTPEEEQELVNRLEALEDRVEVIEKGLESIVSGIERLASSQKEYIDERTAGTSDVSRAGKTMRNPFET